MIYIGRELQVCIVCTTTVWCLLELYYFHTGLKNYPGDSQDNVFYDINTVMFSTANCWQITSMLNVKCYVIWEYIWHLIVQQCWLAVIWEYIWHFIEGLCWLAMMDKQFLSCTNTSQILIGWLPTCFMIICLEDLFPRVNDFVTWHN